MERMLQVELRLKLTPYRDDKGFIESVGGELYWSGIQMEPDDRVVHITLRVPASLWEAPRIDVDVRSALQGMLDEIRAEGLELDVQR